MERMRHGYSHDTRGDGRTVVKRYTGPEAALRKHTERAALLTLAELLPVPRVLPGEDDLTTSHVPGVHGQELLEAGHAAEVLHSCGTMLRRLQALDPAVVLGRPGTVVVHGDYGPNNMLFDPETFEVTAILDWEWSHAGNPLDDLAWCEWIVRTHHPPDVGALDRLFAGYGSRPPWAHRHERQLARCRELLRAVQPDQEAVRLWQNRLDTTAGWQEQ